MLETAIHGAPKGTCIHFKDSDYQRWRWQNVSDLSLAGKPGSFRVRSEINRYGAT